MSDPVTSWAQAYKMFQTCDRHGIDQAQGIDMVTVDNKSAFYLQLETACLASKFIELLSLGNYRSIPALLTISSHLKCQLADVVSAA